MKERKTRRERRLLVTRKKQNRQTDQTKPKTTKTAQNLWKTTKLKCGWPRHGVLSSGVRKYLWKPAPCLWIVSSQACEPGGKLGKPSLPRTEWGCNLTLFSAGKFSTFWSNTMLSPAKVLFLSHAMVKTTPDSRSSTVISCTSAFNPGTA